MWPLVLRKHRQRDIGESNTNYVEESQKSTFFFFRIAEETVLYNFV